MGTLVLGKLESGSIAKAQQLTMMPNRVRLQNNTICYRNHYESECDVTYGQVWWPILGICALHLTHPKCTHTQQWTHTHREHTPGAVGSHLCCGTRGAVGGSVPCSRVSPQSWYWGWRERCTFTPPTYNSCRTWDSEPATFGFPTTSP